MLNIVINMIIANSLHVRREVMRNFHTGNRIIHPRVIGIEKHVICLHRIVARLRSGILGCVVQLSHGRQLPLELRQRPDGVDSKVSLADPHHGFQSKATIANCVRVDVVVRK